MDSNAASLPTVKQPSPLHLPNEDRSASEVPLSSATMGLRPPPVIRCGLLMFLVKAMLKTRGFGGTIRWIRRRVGTIPKARSVDLEVVKAWEHAVATAGALYPGR